MLESIQVQKQHGKEITPSPIYPSMGASQLLHEQNPIWQPGEWILKSLLFGLLVLGQHVAQYDDAQSIGRRYRRQDEIGTPYCVTIDFDTLEDHQVTIRDRDTMHQARIPINDLVDVLRDKLEHGW